jgi:CPA1 family monovalent cation:H+ antiporter
LSLRLRDWARDPRVEITLSLLTPYAAFLVPLQLGGSGVLATVAAGLFVSWNGPLLIPAATRLQGIFFWDVVVYLLEGFVFLVTGMQTRTLFIRMHEVPCQHFAFAILLTVAVVIVTRFIWVYPAAVCTENSNPDVVMVKSAQNGVRTYEAGSLNRTRDRRILVQ